MVTQDARKILWIFGEDRNYVQCPFYPNSNPRQLIQDMPLYSKDQAFDLPSGLVVSRAGL